MVVPDISPRAFAAVSVGTCKGWCFLMGLVTPGFQNKPSDTYMYARIKFHTYIYIISE
jgi:hypothetical protein